MKKQISKIISAPQYQNSLLGSATRWLIRVTDRSVYSYSPHFKLMMQVPERPHYSWCMLKAAELAKRLGHDRMSALEFGVAGGNGLTFMAEYAKEVKKATGVTVECYGFDTGKGMPPPEGAKDLPYWFQEAQYVMDVDALQARIPDATLVLGDIRDTVQSFVETFDPAPIGAIFNDTDYWSSTLASFRLFETAETRPQNFLPRQFLYFDDVTGSEFEMYGICNGQLRAIEEFNGSQDKVAIALNRNLLAKTHISYRYHIYYSHIFDHPQYSTYIGAERQAELSVALQLKQPKS